MAEALWHARHCDLCGLGSADVNSSATWGVLYILAMHNTSSVILHFDHESPVRSRNVAAHETNEDCVTFIGHAF